MFSSLPHFPPSQYQLRPHYLSPLLGHDRRNYDTVKVQVSGGDRVKYFRRPLIPYVPVIGGQVVYARRVPKEVAKIEERPSSSGVRTVGVQTTYRESDAQTDPYSPEYILPNNSAPPELLALATLKFGAGLPVGVAELEMIERARAKRAWEASLPKVVDQESFEKRLKMMEEMELLEWQEREEEIAWMHEARLQILSKVIRQREDETELQNNERIEHMWQKKLQERDTLVEKIQSKRVKALRKINEKRAELTNFAPKKRDIIADYSNYSSSVYAPKIRDGMFVDKPSTMMKLNLDEINSYEGLMQLEQTFSNSVLKADLSIPQKYNLRSLSARREMHVQEQLKQMDLKLKERKLMQQSEEKPLKYSQKIEKPPQRPPTPKIEPPEVEEENMEIAALQLQRLIRGRFAQNLMYQGKERRSSLISELRTRIGVKKAVDHKLEHMNQTNASLAQTMQPPATVKVPANTVETKIAEAQTIIEHDAELLMEEPKAPSAEPIDKISFESVNADDAEIETKSEEENMLLEGSEVYEDPDELSPLLSATLASALSSGVNSTEYRTNFEKLNKQFPVGTAQRELYERLLLEQTLEVNIQGEYIGKTFDFLSKELVRLREERRIAAMVKLAERTRRMREAEESGRRQGEIKRREEEDEIFRQIMRVHQETVDSYLEDVISSSVNLSSSMEARLQIQKKANKINEIVDILEKREKEENKDSDNFTVSDLVSAFLFPEVERQILRDALERDQQKYLIAAHTAVNQVISNVEESGVIKRQTSFTGLDSLDNSQSAPSSAKPRKMGSIATKSTPGLSKTNERSTPEMPEFRTSSRSMKNLGSRSITPNSERASASKSRRQPTPK
ncbi:Cilia- and flagella-associated protein 91 [Nowakowskiella sp. JEL0407]|nr:Cilia- and flagella-associated protein 91 [Nowakowskiella sp. JEL0407]